MSALSNVFIDIDISENVQPGHWLSLEIEIILIWVPEIPTGVLGDNSNKSENNRLQFLKVLWDCLG